MDTDTDPTDLFLNLGDWQYSDHGDDEDEGGSAVDPQLSLSSSLETYLLGFVLVNIVGLQYYTGSICGREMVGLVREPLNTHDENAIRVLPAESRSFDDSPAVSFRSPGSRSGSGEIGDETTRSGPETIRSWPDFS